MRYQPFLHFLYTPLLQGIRSKVKISLFRIISVTSSNSEVNEDRIEKIAAKQFQRSLRPHLTVNIQPEESEPFKESRLR